MILTITLDLQNLKRLSISKRAAQKFYIDRKLYDMEVKVQYYFKMSNRFAALDNLHEDDDDDDDDDEINNSLMKSAQNG